MSDQDGEDYEELGDEEEEELIDDADHDEEDEDEEEDKEPEEEVEENILTEPQIAECISLLSKIGNGITYEFIRLDCKERQLTNVDILAQYCHLRIVDLSNNFLRDISVLSNLTNLLALRCEHNRLQSATLQPLPYLQKLSFANNKISTFEGIDHPMLEHLGLNYNEITTVTGMEPNMLGKLHTLELRGNKLETVEGLNLPGLKNLFLAENHITTLEGIGRLEQLTSLHLRNNLIVKLDGFSENNSELQYLNLRGNKISGMAELSKLQCLKAMKSISLMENPIAEEEDYRMEVLIQLKDLIRLDKDEFMEEDRGEAELIHKQRKLDNMIVPKQDSSEEPSHESAVEE